MEEDDDNFLDGVIEFGDGRQYKIEANDLPASQSLESASTPEHTARSRLEDFASPKDTIAAISVSKEERFADDFDRSWPKSRTSPALPTRDFPPGASQQSPSNALPPASPVAPVPPSLHSPPESSRVLFNEHSNRLEPYGSAHRPGTLPPKRGHQDLPSSSSDPRGLRDAQTNSPVYNSVQLLQKPGADHSSRARGFSGGSSGGFVPGDRRDRDSSRRDGFVNANSGPPLSPRLLRDLPHTGPPSVAGREREPHHEARGRRTSMGPPPVPLHRGPSKDNGRQLPPHLANAPPGMSPPQRRRPLQDSKFPSPPAESARRASQSPVLVHTPAARISPAVQPVTLPQLSAPELDEARKDVMQSAAARAKQRRQQEEEERAKAQERARRKAAELEEKAKAAEVERKKAKEALESEQTVKTQV